MWGSTGFGGHTKCSVFISLEPEDDGTEGDDDNRETNTWATRMPGSLMAGWCGGGDGEGWVLALQRLG